MVPRGSALTAAAVVFMYKNKEWLVGNALGAKANVVNTPKTRMLAF